jgi:hypothetical protein
MLCDNLLLYISLGEKQVGQKLEWELKERSGFGLDILRQGKRSAEGNKVHRNSQGRRSIGATGYCNGYDKCVARQQLCKHGPTRNNR